MKKNIGFMVNSDTGLVWSRVGSEVAVPVLDYEGMTYDNNFATSYNLEKFSVFSVCKELGYMKGTRKIPLNIKNAHRKFWGMKELT